MQTYFTIGRIIHYNTLEVPFKCGGDDYGKDSGDSFMGIDVYKCIKL